MLESHAGIVEASLNGPAGAIAVLSESVAVHAGTRAGLSGASEIGADRRAVLWAVSPRRYFCAAHASRSH